MSEPKYKCPRCAADPQPAGFGSPRNCAFEEGGAFTSDNWNCATIEAILARDDMEDHRLTDESMQAVPWWFEYEVTEYFGGGTDTAQHGWILTTRYKWRGQTDAACYFGRDGAQPLTLALADAFLNHRAPHPDGAVPTGPGDAPGDEGVSPL